MQESHNRFSPLIDALEADLIPVPGSVLSLVPQSEPVSIQWGSSPEFLRRGPDLDRQNPTQRVWGGMVCP